MSVFQKIAFATACVSVALSGCASVEKINNSASSYIKDLDQSTKRRMNGQYYDETTGLMWYFCTAGNKWNDVEDISYPGCGHYYGSGVSLNAKDTEKYITEFINGKNFGGYSDWRLPTVFEVEQLRLANCKEWHKRKTGDVLTEKGRESTYEIATRTTLDNQGRLIEISACAEDNLDAFDKSIRMTLEHRYKQENLYTSTARRIRVKESSLSKNYKSMVVDEGYEEARLTNLIPGWEVYDEDLDDGLAQFYIVRQHTPAKEAAK